MLLSELRLSSHFLHLRFLPLSEHKDNQTKELKCELNAIKRLIAKSFFQLFLFITVSECNIGDFFGKWKLFY
jgi:hypothetical protein